MGNEETREWHRAERFATAEKLRSYIIASDKLDRLALLDLAAALERAASDEACYLAARMANDAR